MDSGPAIVIWKEKRKIQTENVDKKIIKTQTHTSLPQICNALQSL